MRNLLEALERDLERARETDKIMNFWKYLAGFVVLEIVAVALSFFSLQFWKVPKAQYWTAYFVLLVLWNVIPFLYTAYFIYLLIKRRNSHFGRSYAFLSDLGKALEALGLDPEYVEAKASELRAMGTRNAALNAVLSVVIPFYIFYVYHFLNKDFHVHSVIEMSAFEMAVEELRRKGARVRLTTAEICEGIVPDRSTFLYGILTIITGVFIIYWTYTVFNDPNRHFRVHERLERRLIDELGELFNK